MSLPAKPNNPASVDLFFTEEEEGHAKAVTVTNSHSRETPELRMCLMMTVSKMLTFEPAKEPEDDSDDDDVGDEDDVVDETHLNKSPLMKKVTKSV